MKRRLALTFAGSAAIVLTAGGAAVAANLGILGTASQEPVGRLDANTVSDLSSPVTSIDPIVVTIDEIVPVPVDEPTTVAPGDDRGHDRDDDRGDDADGRRDGSGPGPRPTPTTAAPTSTTVGTSNSGPGRVDDDHGDTDDDHRGSGTSGSSGSRSGDDHDDD